jgi:arabinose-5-phosphate isomerase
MTSRAEQITPAEDTDLAAARRVLDLAAGALSALSLTLDHGFAAALDRLDAVSGRVIVTGMGKSGHVARKIAATLASTGCPAQFVHPGEASHGDLGMITKEDAVLALSNSGNTAELGDIAAYCRRFRIPLLAITARRDSALAGDADVALILPRAEEACPMGLAPTTSTTMMMALGDALAIALLERKGFSADDFQLLHPGGSLGHKLLRVKDVMRGAEELPLCRPDTPMSEALIVMTERSFGCIGVTDEQGRLAGIITDGDLRRHMSPELLAAGAGQVMTAGPKTVHGQMLAAEALGIMNANSITSLFVVEQERPTGIVRMHDCLSVGVA